MDIAYISPQYGFLRGSQYWPPKIKTIQEKFQVLDKDGNEHFVTAVEIFADQIKGWFFEIGRGLTSPAAGFVILMIAVGFVEKQGQLLFGQSSHRKSRTTFKDSLVEILKGRVSIDNLTASQIEVELRNIADCIYDNVRSGLFHDFMIRYGIELRSLEAEKPIQVMWNKTGTLIEGIVLDPRGFLNLLESYFENYLTQLQSDSVKQTHFVNGWNQIDKHNEQTEPVGYSQLRTYPRPYSNQINPANFSGTITSSIQSGIGSESAYHLDWGIEDTSDDDKNTYSINPFD